MIGHSTTKESSCGARPACENISLPSDPDLTIMGPCQASEKRGDQASLFSYSSIIEFPGHTLIRLGL